MTGSAKRKMAVLAAVLAASVLAPPALAVHIYRGPGGGCTEASGTLTDDAGPAPGPATATVQVMHNTFNDAATAIPETRINVGESVIWEWNSAHCHSIVSDAGTFYSGYHYPTEAPESPSAVPGLFHYPLPDDTPTLRYQRTFLEPGTYSYFCEHHAAIGMVGTVVVVA